MSRAVTCQPLLVGDGDDHYIQAVRTELLVRGAQPITVDLEPVTRAGFSLSQKRTVLRLDDAVLDLVLPRVGWLREAP